MKGLNLSEKKKTKQQNHKTTKPQNHKTTKQQVMLKITTSGNLETDEPINSTMNHQEIKNWLKTFRNGFFMDACNFDDLCDHKKVNELTAEDWKQRAIDSNEALQGSLCKLLSSFEVVKDMETKPIKLNINKAIYLYFFLHPRPVLASTLKNLNENPRWYLLSIDEKLRIAACDTEKLLHAWNNQTVYGSLEELNDFQSRLSDIMFEL